MLWASSWPPCQPGLRTWLWLRYGFEPRFLAASPLQCWAQNGCCSRSTRTAHHLPGEAGGPIHCDWPVAERGRSGRRSRLVLSYWGALSWSVRAGQWGRSELHKALSWRPFFLVSLVWRREHQCQEGDQRQRSHGEWLHFSPVIFPQRRHLHFLTTLPQELESFLIEG